MTEKGTWRQAEHSEWGWESKMDAGSEQSLRRPWTRGGCLSLWLSQIPVVAVFPSICVEWDGTFYTGMPSAESEILF